MQQKIRNNDDFFHLERNSELSGRGTVSLINDTVHIFTAVGQNTTKEDFFDKIVLTGWEKKDVPRSRNYTCCFIYAATPAHTFSSKMSEKRHWSYVGYAKLEVKQYVCPNVKREKHLVPSAVTLSVGSECPKAKNKYIAVDMPAAQPGEQMAVCAKIVFGNISASSMIEWFEYQNLMGVSKVLVYTYNLNKAAKKVLDFYATTGVVEYYPFSLPQKGKFLCSATLARIL